MNYVVATYLVRFAGLLLVIPAIFWETLAGWRFPGLADGRIRMALFAAGIAIYAGASIAYYILHKKDVARHRAEMEKTHE